MKTYLRTALALTLIATLSCADTPGAPPTDETQTPIDVRADRGTERIDPVHTHRIADGDEAREFFEDGTARIDSPAEFRQFSAMVDAADLSELQFRVPSGDGEWSDWRNVDITWNEGNFYNLLVRLDEPVRSIELRGGERILSTEFEFYDRVIARDDFITGPRVTDDGEFESLDSPEDALTAMSSVAPSSLVTSRTQWGATDPGKICGNVVSPYRMAIHHTYAPSSDGGDPAARMRQMQSYHMNTLGWCDIGYHFVVAQSGEILQGRSRSDRPGAHVGGHNSGNVGISFIADFTTQTPTDTQLDAGAAIVEWVHNEHGVPLDRSVIKGHREHSGQTTTCPGTAMVNRINEIINRAAGGGSAPDPEPEPEPEFDATLEVTTLDIDDFYRDGSSHGVPDALPGQHFQAHVDLTNKSDERLEDVEIGVSIETPYVEATDYTIYTDHPEYDLSTWSINDADPTEGSANPTDLSGTTHLEMHGFAPYETKRIVIDLAADRYSIGQTDHVDIRAWLTFADSDDDVDAGPVFDGHGGSWGDQASTSEIGDRLRDSTQVDVLSRDEWLFESLEDEADLEGWHACYPGHHDELIHNTNFGALAMEVTGDAACLAAPGWTEIDADAYDEMVIEVRAHTGDHDKAVFWATDDDLGADQFPCDEVHRSYGPNRYASSAAVSEDAFPSGADVAVLVLGTEPTPDAISAGALAANLGGPLLLTDDDHLPEPIEDELIRLDVDEVLIVGGSSVIEDPVKDDVTALGIDVERLAGPNRFATATVVAGEVGSSDKAVILSGATRHLVDGVYGATLAAHLDAPVLLAEGDLLPTETEVALDLLDVEETYIVGGESVISSSVEAALPSPTRLSGANRYETAMAVADFIFESDDAPDHVYIARDDNVIDAFSASAIGDVVMLSRPDRLTHGVSNTLTGHADSATLVGGTAALSEDVEKDACHAFRVQAAYDDSRAVGFEAPGDSDFHTLIVPLGDDADWGGLVTYLRIMPLYDQAPPSSDSPWQDIGKIFFQNSATQETSSDVHGYTTGTTVDIEPIDDPIDPDDGGDDSSDPSDDDSDDPSDDDSDDPSDDDSDDPSDDDSDDTGAPSDDDADEGTTTTAQSSSCSTTGGDQAPTTLVVLLMLVGLAKAVRSRS